MRILPAFTCFIVLSSAAAAPEVIERRQDITISADDWSHRDTGRMTTGGAIPVGGMKALVSHLDYPASLRRQRISGTMRVGVALDARGHLLTARVIQPLHPALDAMVLRAVRSCRWEPATKNGKKIAWSFSFPITFGPPKT